MAYLKQVRTKKLVPVPHHTRIGRSVDAEIRLEDRRVSSEHALIFWDRGAWLVKDLGSRNGTVVDGQRLESGGRAVLRAGSSLRIGCAEEHWLLESGEGPEVLACCRETGQWLEGEHGHLEVGDKHVLQTEDGMTFFFETEGVREVVTNRQNVHVGAQEWRLFIPPPTPEGRTLTARGVLVCSDVTLHFSVSPDEEHVQVDLVSPGATKPLRPRALDFMLLALARARIADKSSGTVKSSEQGWVYLDELALSLGLDATHVNVDIYRARRRFEAAGVQGADEMIERRKYTRALRLGCAHVEIE